MGHVVEAVEIRAQNAVPGVTRERRKGRICVRARVRNDAPVGPVLLEVLAEHTRTGLALGDIELEQIGLPTGRADPLGDLEPGIAASAKVDADAEAALGEPLRDGSADATAGSGDEDAATQREPSGAKRELER